MMMNFGRVAFTALMIATMTGALSAQSVELVSRAHPSQNSDTGAGARATVSYFSEAVPKPPSISADGRSIVFLSNASNLVPGQQDLNARPDVFLKDLVTGTTTLVSRAMSSPAQAGNDGSDEAVISADGRYVAFVSRATDLVPGQESVRFYETDQDVLLYDTVAGSITLVADTSEALEGFQDLTISSDGRFIVFVTGANDIIPGQQGEGSSNVFLYDRVEKTTTLVSHTGTSPQTGGGGRHPALSADGRYVVFTGRGSDSIPGILIYDRILGSLVSIGEGGTALISADGKYVAVSGSMVYLYNRETREKTLLSELGDGPLAINSDGRFIAFIRIEGFASGAAVSALTLYDRISQTFTRMTPRSEGQAVYGGEFGIPMISADGRYTVFTSYDPGLVPGQVDILSAWDVFLFDRNSGTVTLVSHASSSASVTGDSFSYSPAISANGARIVFDSTASNLVEGVKDLNEGHDFFVHEVASGSNTVISYRAPSLPSLSPSAESQVSALSADGRFVAFESKSPHLISGQVDSNGTTDVFLYDRSTQALTLVSRTRTSSSQTANGQSVQPVLSADGRYVAFVSNATDIVTENNPTETVYKVFLFDRITGTSVLVGRTGQPAGPELSGWNVQQRISQDGRWVVFTSLATDLIAGQQEQNPDPDPLTLDLFLWDRVSGSTMLVSRSNAGDTTTARGSSYLRGFSADGRYVLFNSSANDLVPGQIEPTDSFDTFQFDRITRRVALVSHARGSAAVAVSGAGSDMSADGRFIVFTSYAEGLDPGTPPGVEESIYVYDRSSAMAQWVAELNAPIHPRISADGRYVVFNSLRDLVPDLITAGEHIYLYDRVSKTIALVTHPAIPNGRGSAGNHGTATISSDGRYIAFTSNAIDLVDGLVQVPRRDRYDIFLLDRVANTTVLVSRVNGSPLTAAGNALNPLLSASGRQVAFTSSVDLVRGDFNLRADAYVFSLDPPPTTGPTPLPPCKLLDTRRRADRPVLTSNVQRTVTVRGACGVPTTAKQVLVNVSVFNPSGKGNLRFYPGAVTATPSGILRFERGATRTETFTLPLSTTGTLTVLPFVSGKGTVHMAVEVTGYVP